MSYVYDIEHEKRGMAYHLHHGLGLRNTNRHPPHQMQLTMQNGRSGKSMIFGPLKRAHIVEVIRLICTGSGEGCCPGVLGDQNNVIFRTLHREPSLRYQKKES